MKKSLVKSVTLREWIDETGAETVAKVTKVQPQTVRLWRRGVCLPRTAQMHAVYKFSRGKVSYETMIHDFLKQSGSKI